MLLCALVRLQERTLANAEMETEQQPSCVGAAARFLRQSWLRFVVVSSVLLLPCFWHRRIEAGDLASHAYNAWLAQLIEKGQASGLYFSGQRSEEPRVGKE